MMTIGGNSNCIVRESTVIYHIALLNILCAFRKSATVIVCAQKKKNLRVHAEPALPVFVQPTRCGEIELFSFVKTVLFPNQFFHFHHAKQSGTDEAAQPIFGRIQCHLMIIVHDYII